MYEIEEDKKIGAIEKTLHILNAFAESPHIYSAKELSCKLGFSKPTVHRILNYLEEENYIKRVLASKYTIGYRAYQMGMVYANTTDIYLEIRRVIDSLAQKIGEQVGYAVLEGTDVVSLYESQMQDSRIRYIAGAIYPINSGCYGKVLMTFSYTEEELKEILSNITLQQVSPGAIMNPQKLLTEYENIRQKGYGESVDEYLDGTIGLGVPVFRFDGTLAGCIALGAIKSDSFYGNKERYKQELFKSAEELRNIFI